MSPSQVQPSARRHAFLPLDGEGRVEAVERQLGEAIYAGVLSDGEQLPSEHELAQQLGVSTVTLREALAGLRRGGLVRTRRGRGGGTFVRSSAEVTRRYLDGRLRSLSVDDLRDLGDHRAAITTAAAELAAARASDADLATLRHHVAALAGAGGAARRHGADRRFHVELAAAARSARLVGAEVALQREIGPLLWHFAGDELAAAARRDHRAIVAAVARRDAGRARRACAAHVAAETLALIAARRRLPAADGGGARAQAAEPRPDRRRGDGGRAVRAASEAVLTPLRGAIADVFAGLEDLRARVVELARDDPPLRRAALGPLGELILSHLERGAGPIIGTGIVFAPGIVLDEPRWLEWRWVPAGRAPVALDASLDPDDVRFYDYEHAEWFATPRDSGRRWIAGPFVDYSCTDRHAFTLTLPVTVAGAFIGVAGADVTVARIEELAGPRLDAVPAEAALVNRRGRVIAANTASLLPGTLHPCAATAADAEPGVWRAGEDGAAALSDADLQWAVITRPRDA